MSMPPDQWRSIAPAMAQALEKARRSDRVGQAYMLVSEERENSEVFARGWARTVCCREPDERGRACGKCANCLAWDQECYSELMILQPESKMCTIKLEPMHNFEERLWLSVPDGLYRVAMIRDAHCMSIESQNSFLKTLEEPPSRTLLLLLTTSPQLLLPTIRSRCQSVMLLRNRVDYSLLVPPELMSVLARMYRGAGSRVAFNASGQLKEILGNFKGEAEKVVKANSKNADWEVVRKGNQQLAAELDELMEARVKTEYIRLRTAVIECIQAWFQQWLLAAGGVSAEKLPQPEFIAAMQAGGWRVPSMPEAAAALRAVQKLKDGLRYNLPETLCWDAFCLSICEKR